MSFKVAGLFSGVGMFEHAATQLGGQVVWSVEIEDFNRRVLEARLDGEHLADVREVDAGLPAIDLLVGGFPCQDISNAGMRAGIGGERSGLWSEMARVIGIYQPRAVVIENVSVLRRRGLNVVLEDLHRLGYDIQWDCIPAIAVGAPHIRDRIWVVATKTQVGAPAFFPAWEWGALPEDLPRAGCATAEGVFYATPRAEVGACKRAMSQRGAPIFLTPVAQDDGKSPEAHLAMKQRLGGRTQITSLAVLARAGFVQPNVWPTPVGTDAIGARNATARRPNGNGKHNSGYTLTDALILSGDLAMPATGIWPTPTASQGDGRSGQPERMDGRRRNLIDAVAKWPTPTGADGAGGPGTSPNRTGGMNLRTAVVRTGETPAASSLNPDWVEWLMGMPIGWTNPDAEVVEHPGWEVEPDLPRTLEKVPARRQRLKATGNALVPQVARIPIAQAVGHA